MERLKGYDKAQVYTDTERLPVGGYIIKILDAKEQTTEWGKSLILSFDIDEGERKGFYAENYRSQTGEEKKWKGVYRLRVPKDDGSEQDNWTMRRFKTAIYNFEESNQGYRWDWDELKLKGKKIGAIFNNKEYEIDGRHGFYTNCYGLVSVEKIRTGKFTIPEDTLLKNSGNSRSKETHSSVGDGFINIPDNVEDEGLPFN